MMTPDELAKEAALERRRAEERLQYESEMREQERQHDAEQALSYAIDVLGLPGVLSALSTIVSRPAPAGEPEPF